MVKVLEGKLEEFLKELENVREEKNNVMREQEDLLVLLSDQDSKCREYKVTTYAYTYYSAHSPRGFSVALLSLTIYIYRFHHYFPITINPNPPCQLFLWEETGEPGENPRLSAEC